MTVQQTALRVIKHPLFFTAAIALCGLGFVISMVLTYVPILIVETNYQYQRVLRDVFHAEDLRSLILPNLTFDKIGLQYRDFGMEVPKLFLNEPIVFNVDPENSKEYSEALKKGIAHAAGTDLPPYDGLGYYFAHSSSPELRNQYNAIFYLLGKLEQGDTVNLWYHDTKYEYVVTGTKITEPNDTSFLRENYALPTIVLQTCWPPGTTQKRLLVFAERKTAQ
jgi:sortase A